MSDEPIYSARSIVKEYRHQGQPVPVLRGLDLDVQRGEMLAIVGHSGVGKSTLLNILGLLDAPTEGQLIYRGREEALRGRDLSRLDISGKAWVRNREFGFVFQFYHLLPDLSVIENVLLPIMIVQSRKAFRAERTESVRRAEELLDRVGILHRKDFMPTQLSGGERQRAAIARALMNGPQIVFCDEPTGNLDTITGAKIHELILELNTRLGVSFVIVTHDEDLANLTHRKLAMRDGVFVREEKPGAA